MKIQTGTDESRNQAISVSSATGTQEERTAQAGEKSQKKGDSKTIFAGDLGICMQTDLITQKKKSAQKQALKMIEDAWDIDRRFDKSIDGYRDRLAELAAEKEANWEEIEKRDGWKEDLRQTYGVAGDSQEQKDLELLEKEQDWISGVGRDGRKPVLTEEEKERLAGIHENGLTEYQERCMAIDAQQGRFERSNAQIDEESRAYNAAIRSTKQERLKNNEMVKAQKKADIVLEAASKEVIGMLTDEAKDYVDQKFEEQVEEAKKKAEEKAEQEEKVEQRQEKAEELQQRIDETREKRKEQEDDRKEAEERARLEEELLDGMTQAGIGGIGATREAQSEIKTMLHKMNLLDEDIKGSIVEAKLEAYS